MSQLSTYEFTTDQERLLVKVKVPQSGYKLKVGDMLLLGPIPSVYHHPKNAYAYDLHSGRQRGRYAFEWFEIVQKFPDEGEFNSFFGKCKNEVISSTKYSPEQLTLF